MTAPLIPEYISEQFGLLIAIIIGFGFGFALEQAGFSSSRKLAGLFYGYDFTVLRVFFTAGVTAMLGSVIMSKMGWLDLDLIYINPTYLYAALIGGGIMGLGFILGGFCPGTSIVSAAVGRIDAMFFVLGGGLGILFFGELYPVFETMHTDAYMGSPTVNDWLSISKETFALGLTLIALGAFAATYFIEKRVNNLAMERWKPIPRLKIIGFVSLLGIPAVAIQWSPDYKEGIWQDASEAKNLASKTVDPDKVAFLIMRPESKTINVIDVRDTLRFNKSHIPTAINIPLRDLLENKWENVLKGHNKLNIFYADNDEDAKKAVYIARAMGYRNNHVLQGGLSLFVRTIFHEKTLTENPSPQEKFNIRFREKARRLLPAIDKERKSKPIVKPKKKKKAQGGCS